MVAALLLQIVQSYAAQTAARGTAIVTVDALNMMLIAVLVFLILRQVMPIAAAWPAACAELVRPAEPDASYASDFAQPRGVDPAAFAAPTIVAARRAVAIAARAGQYGYHRAKEHP